MDQCPTCSVPLIRQQTAHGYVYVCPQCGGRAATLPVLRKSGASRQFLGDLWQRCRTEKVPRRRPCPLCTRPMAEVTLPGAWHTLTLDVCGRCALIWFDASEYEALPRAPEPEPVPVEATMSPEAREQLALYRVQQIGEQARRESFNDGPEQSWQWLPAILGLPVELDAPAVSRRPWATWALVALCVLTTVPLLLADVPIRDEIYQQWGFVPAEWARGGGATLLTSFLLHGGLFHLIGNMYFLMVFGDNVEDRLGRVAYLGLLAGGHLLGMLAQGLFGPDATVPCVGASAGIGGVIACYAIQFPQVRLGFMFRFHFLFRWFHLSAAWALVLFILMQAAGAYFQLRGFGAVSYLGHLGGLSVGLTLALVHRAQQRRDVDRAIGLESR